MLRTCKAPAGRVLEVVRLADARSADPSATTVMIGPCNPVELVVRIDELADQRNVIDELRGFGSVRLSQIQSEEHRRFARSKSAVSHVLASPHV
jgi:hypothetical protein